MKNSIIITPPLMQLNSPYPSGAYLNNFFKTQGFNSKWYDLSIELFYSIFSKEGLVKLFSLTEKQAIILSEQADSRGDPDTAFNIQRYLSTKESWINWIDFITGMLCSGRDGFSGREKEHQFLYSPFAPRGAHMENYLATLDHEPTTDDVRFLCSFALADLADYITAVFDNNFSLIRYAEALTVDERTFGDIEKQINSPVLEEFYKPVLEKIFPEKLEEKTIVCISIPFAGTFLSALYTASFFKKKYGENAVVGIGGGFVNTELREAKEPALGKYIDFISYDRGYGSYYSYLKEIERGASGHQLYKTRIFNKDGTVTEPLWHEAEAEKFEGATTIKNVPDYSDIDFNRYPRLCDDRNPMHRIWSDGAWIKAYLAHGCYWAKCAFCDTQLDYVCGYKITDVENLYKSLLATAREKGVYGIHFVDEALPPTALVKFGLLNARNGLPLYYWGNVRFEKSFTKDLAAFLSYCGLGGVSAGLEVATGEGLAEINKGTDLESIVAACAAFKEAGILVHAYMIYGFWYDTPQTIIDSMETLRQFFEAGLLDSSFWHKFVLTRNSTVYGQWEKEGRLNMVSGADQSSCFAKNNLHFKGEEKYNKFGAGLDNAVSSWMHGQSLERKVQKWFDFQVPCPNIKKDFIDNYIEKYEKKSHKCHVNYNSCGVYKGPFWLGGNPVVVESAGGSLTGGAGRGSGRGAHGGSASLLMKWIYLQEECEFNIKQKDKDLLLEILNGLKPEAQEETRTEILEKIRGSQELQNILYQLHNRGVVFI